MKKHNFILFSILSLLAWALASPGVFHAWAWNGNQMVQVSEPYEFTQLNSSQPKSMSDGADCLDLHDGMVKIHRCSDETNNSTWISPVDWQVKEVVHDDLDRDGAVEFGLLVWRPFKPWPIDKFLPHAGRIADFHNDQNLSCHFIVIGWDGEKYRELWAGSALADPISRLQAADIDHDGYLELIGIEGKYDSPDHGSLTIWKWQGFGFTLMDKIDGDFSDYSLVQSGENLFLLAN